MRRAGHRVRNQEDFTVRPLTRLLIVVLLAAAVAVSCGKKNKGDDAKEPETAEEYLERARGSFLDKGKTIKDLNKAIELDDKCVEAYEQRMEVYEARFHKTKRVKDAKQAIRDCSKLLKLEPESPKAAEWMRKRGYFKLQLKRYDAAIADLKRSIEKDNWASKSYQYLADAYRAKGQPKRAAEAYTDAIRCDPTDASLYWNRCEIYYDLKEYQKVLFDLTKVIEIQPTAKAHLRRADIYRELGEPHKALEDIQKAKELDPHYDPDAGVW